MRTLTKSRAQNGVVLQDIAEHPNASGVRWHGDYLSMRCPFHDDAEPSLLAYEDGFICRAASCGQMGTLKRLAAQLNDEPCPQETSPVYSVFWPDICDRFGEVYRPKEDFVTLAHDAAAFPDVRAWYERRGLGDMVDRCNLGWWQGWYVTPVYTEQRELMRVILRAGPSLEDAVGHRYEVSPGPPVLYIPDWGLLHTKPKHLLFPFGVYDALSLVHLRFPTVTGAGPDRLPHELFDRFRCKIFIIPDARPAEEMKLALEYKQAFGWRGEVLALKYPEDLKDPNDFLVAGRERNLTLQVGRHCYD